MPVLGYLNKALVTNMHLKPTILLLTLYSIMSVVNCEGSLRGVKESSLHKQIESGWIEGVLDSAYAVEKYLGVPYAQPPVGALRWRRPLPVKPWEGVRETKAFSNWAMQYKFASWVEMDKKKLSEDCLYLNVWTPAERSPEGLPVVVHFHGGGLMVGKADYDLSGMAAKGAVVVSLNYRLNIFGFFAHPELSAEDPRGVSGNYGFLDQLLALQWVKKNISVFGGDPDRITIEGESAGAISVNAHMCSPRSKDLIVGAIATSGGLVRPMPSLQEAEAYGKTVAEAAGFTSLASLRIASAEAILQIYKKGKPRAFWPILDGHFLTNNLSDIMEAGEQAQIPLLIGWNSAELGANAFMGGKILNSRNFTKSVHNRFAEHADTILAMFPHTTKAQVRRSAVDLASLNFQDYNSWKWFDLHRKATDQPVYRFLFSRIAPRRKKVNRITYTPPIGARHSQEVPYAWGTLSNDSLGNYLATDYQISALLQQYYFNFIEKGNPNGDNLPDWPAVDALSEQPAIMNVDIETSLQVAVNDFRYSFFDRIYQRKVYWEK